MSDPTLIGPEVAREWATIEKTHKKSGALTLGRRVNETITIGDDITVTVSRIRENEVKLTIIAPRSLPIHRAEKKD